MISLSYYTYSIYLFFQGSGDQNIFKFIYHILSLMKAHIALVTAVFLIAATAISVNTMTAYARSPVEHTSTTGGANLTGDASKLAPNGAAKGIVAQGEKIFIVVCPRDFQTIKQCEIFVAQPTLTAIKTVKTQ